MTATLVQIEAFPAAKLDAARDLLAKGHARLARGAKRVGQSAPAMPQVKIDRAYTMLFCTKCKRRGGEAGSWRNAPEGSLARQWGDCAPCDPLGRGTGCQGHMFLAVVEPLTGGNLIRQVPGAAVADGDLIGWRQGAIRCDHCGTKRDRKETFILRATGEDAAIAAGTYKQVGRQCLSDFLGGQSPSQIVWLLSIERTIRACGEEDDESWGGGGGRIRQTYDPVDFLTWTAAVVRVSGWISRARAQAEETRSTSDVVQYLLTPQFGAQAQALWHEARVKHAPGKSDEDRGAAALAWAKALPGNSDYERNLSLVAKQSRLDPKHAGILASAVIGYEREVGKQVEQQTVAAGGVVSKHVGALGDRLELVVTVLRVADVETDYGTMHIHTLRDQAGNAIVWKTASKRLDVGWSGLIKGTVKRHAEYRGEQQTELSRIAEQKSKAKKAKKVREDLSPG
jgi:hypothetical protein